MALSGGLPRSETGNAAAAVANRDRRCMIAGQENRMKSIVCLCACLSLVVVRASAQGVAVPLVGFDNMHILTPNPAETREWYIAHLGAVAAPTAGMAYLGKTLVVFLKNEKAQPSTGSTIDHLGVSFADVEKMTELVAAVPGGDTPPRNAGAVQAGFIRPQGVKTDDAGPGVPGCILNLRPGSGRGAEWFRQMMGGEREVERSHRRLQFDDVAARGRQRR